MNRFALVCLTLLVLLAAQLPGNSIAMTHPTSHAEMIALLEDLAARHPHVTVTEEGRSVEGKPLLLVRINPGGDPDPWRILLIGAQHGDEPAGKDAILLLIREIAGNPGLLPPGTELLALPMINPDGNDRDERRNATGRDLNRDHVLITEPETLAAHRVVQRELPHVIVDCHEYGRDSGRYTSLGWVRRADIMMGAMNSPHFSEPLVAAANDWVSGAEAAFAGTGVTYREYYVGGPPPTTEQRPSTMTANDARNGLGGYGGLSFIIESARYTTIRERNSDFADRLNAYRPLLTYLVTRTEDREHLRQLIAAEREAAAPALPPAHYFWGNAEMRVTGELVRDAKTGADIVVPTPNFQHDRIVKRTVPRPSAYAIPAEHAELFRPLLEKHALPFTALTEPLATEAEAARRNPNHPGLEFSDTTATSWAIELQPPTRVTLPSGSLIVPATTGANGRKAALILEPALVEGLYEAEPFGGLEDSEGNLPVLRLP